MQPRHHNRTAHTRSARGFSLIELLIVITLIGVLMGVGIFALQGASQNVKEKATKERMKLVENALVLYHTNYDAYPDSLGLLLSPNIVQGGQGYLKQDGDKDAWGRELAFFSPSENYSWAIFSAGADGQFETTDDIMHFPSEE